MILKAISAGTNRCLLTGAHYDNKCSGGSGFLMMRLFDALMPQPDGREPRWNPAQRGSEAQFIAAATRDCQLRRFLGELIQLLVACERQATYE